MDSNGISRRVVVVVGILAAVVGAGVAIAWSRSEADCLRQELAFVNRRLTRLEVPPIDQPPLKLLRVERIEVISPKGALRAVLVGADDSATISLVCETEGVDLVAASIETRTGETTTRSGTSRLRVGGTGRTSVLAATGETRAGLYVKASGTEPNSAGTIQLTSWGSDRGEPEILVEENGPRDFEEAKASQATGRSQQVTRFRVGNARTADGMELSMSDPQGRTRFAALVGGPETPRITLLDSDGRTRLSLGRAALKGSLGEYETPENTIVSFGEDGIVKWREPR